MAGSGLSCGRMSLGNSKRMLRFGSSANSCLCTSLSPQNTFVGGVVELQSWGGDPGLFLCTASTWLVHSPEIQCVWGGGGGMKPCPPSQERCFARSQEIENMSPPPPGCAATRPSMPDPPVKHGKKLRRNSRTQRQALTYVSILCEASRWSGSLANSNT